MTVRILRKWPLKLAVALAAGLLLVSPVRGWADAAKSQEYYEDAMEWLNKGDFRAAVIQLRNALQQDADNFSARLLLGRLYLQSGNLAAAQQELEYVHRAQPTDETEVFLGRTKLGLRQYEGVLETVRETADDPAFADAKALLRAEALLLLNRLDEATVLAQRLLPAERSAVPANLLLARIEAQQGNRAAAEGHIDAALAQQPDLMDALILRAQLAQQAREFHRVLEVAEQMESLAPADPRGKLIRAEALVRTNDLPEAKAVLADFVQQNPDIPSASFLYARVLMLLTEYEAADQELQKLPENFRQLPATSLVMGLVKYQLGQYPQAEEALARFVVAAGDSGRQARRLLASIQLRDGRPLAALQTLESLTGEASSDVASFQLSASAALRLGNLDLAQKHLRRVTEIGTSADQRQAVTFLQVLATGTTNEAGQLTLPPVSLGVLEALDLAQFGDSDAALEKALALQEQEPDSVIVANLLARLHAGRGDLDEARNALEPVLESHPGDLATITSLNRIDVSEGKFDAVEARLRQALTRDPGNETLILQLAQFLGNQGKRDAAIALLEAKAAELPESLDIRRNLISVRLNQNQPEAARPWVEQARAIGEAGDVAGLVMAGDAYLELKDYPAAVSTFQLLTEKRPDSADAFLKLAQAKFLAGDTDAAKATLEELLAASPTNMAANRALIAIHLGEPDEAAALAVADRAGMDSPVLGAVLRAGIYRNLNRMDEAVATLQEQLSATPSTGLVQQTYSMLIAAGRREEAATLLSSWLSDNPDDLAILQMLSGQFLEEQRYPEASVLLERAFSLQPNDVIILNNLAWLRYELERPGAVQLARRAYRMAPQVPAIADTLGWILVREGEVAEGLKLLYTAADAAPDNGDIAYHVAFALNETGEKEKAAEVLDRVLAANEIDERNFTERAKAEELRAKLP